MTHLLPTVFTPRLTLPPPAQVRNILHHASHGPAEQLVVLVVHGDHDEQLRLTWRLVQALPQGVVIGLHDQYGALQYGKL
jgi:hypothetical protein